MILKIMIVAGSPLFARTNLGALTFGSCSVDGPRCRIISTLQDLKELAPFGRVIFFGALSGAADPLPPEGLHEKNRSVIGFSFGHYRRFRPQSVQKTMRRAIRFVADGKIRLVVGGRFPLKRAAEAHAYLEARKALSKVILVPE